MQLPKHFAYRRVETSYYATRFMPPNRALTAAEIDGVAREARDDYSYIYRGTIPEKAEESIAKMTKLAHAHSKRVMKKQLLRPYTEGVDVSNIPDENDVRAACRRVRDHVIASGVDLENDPVQVRELVELEQTAQLVHSDARLKCAEGRKDIESFEAIERFFASVAEQSRLGGRDPATDPKRKTEIQNVKARRHFAVGGEVSKAIAEEILSPQVRDEMVNDVFRHFQAIIETAQTNCPEILGPVDARGNLMLPKTWRPQLSKGGCVCVTMRQSVAQANPA